MELICKQCGNNRSKGRTLCNVCHTLKRRVSRDEIIFYPDEKWASIKENPKYKVSNYGRVMSLFSNNSIWENKCILKPRISKKGYHFYTIIPKTPTGVHRLVAIAFIPNPENKREVNHKDFNPSNNHVDNLEWATHKENIVYSAKAGRFRHNEKQRNHFKKLQEKKRTPVNQLTMEGVFVKRFETAKDASEYFGRPNSSNIGLCCRGRIRYCYGFKWEFALK
jgi:hypothetical protein